ncbi:hypothetical protein [Nesterenkonia haasae]|uniref:hypothetical protein n=1 Tax=Nesterenkonia haasae TaxID=2587813 RepID=UPI001391955E|nr:hypothetical protein [Nesterenkonia haasae]NDK33223.1 hypothetical protein [Nesterenkonia haasae]
MALDDVVALMEVLVDSQWSAAGGAGLRAALEQQWRRTRIQRCFFHTRAAVIRHTTLTPRLEAGREILALTRELMKVRDLDDAAAWTGAYAS